jgi:hypothetical protein
VGRLANRAKPYLTSAMSSAQTTGDGDKLFRMGMNEPDASQNAQFVLNVLHWLSDLLQD